MDAKGDMESGGRLPDVAISVQKGADPVPVAERGSRLRLRWPARRHWARAMVALLLVVLLGGRQAGPEPVESANPPLVGFSFSPAAVPTGVDPVTSLEDLLTTLQPDVVRLPVYWSDVMPTPGVIDFTQTDALLSAVTQHNLADPQHPTRVILVVGVRNIDYPEVWAPTWMSDRDLRDLTSVVHTPDFEDYFTSTIEHYATDPLLLDWQVENEPYDNVTSGLSSNVAIGNLALRGEVQLIRRLDRLHPVIVTTFDSATVALDQEENSSLSWLLRLLPIPQAVGHPSDALSAGDALGLDAYVVTPTTPLKQATADVRIGWKAAALDYWARQSIDVNKPLWITEMQASPWAGAPNFTTKDLLFSARAYSRVGATGVLLWGVENWPQNPRWMRAGKEAVQILRQEAGRARLPGDGAKD
ncbi:MAG TPA: hypothetical protein VIA06_19865 [Candidatus Dormibacteraeota bacterium]|nr:hypothetical protein [Candidatus Dormibacteraeota bacterium]